MLSRKKDWQQELEQLEQDERQKKQEQKKRLASELHSQRIKAGRARKMSNQLVVHQPHAVAVQQPQREQQLSILDLDPKAMASKAAEIASVLKDIILQQGLFTTISGKKHVRVEGWQTMGSFLGFATREQGVVKLPDGSYEATVEVYNIRSKDVVGVSSALCSVAEKRWGAAEDYARRSMAITRATSKAYRLSFGWVMALAGYETTPAEEMPVPESVVHQYKQPYQKAGPPAAPQAIKIPTFKSSDAAQIKLLTDGLRNCNVPEALHTAIIEYMDGKEYSHVNVKEAIEHAKQHEIFEG